MIRLYFIRLITSTQLLKTPSFEGITPEDNINTQVFSKTKRLFLLVICFAPQKQPSVIIFHMQTQNTNSLSLPPLAYNTEWTFHIILRC